MENLLKVADSTSNWRYFLRRINAIGFALHTELAGLFRAIARDDSVSAVILTGAGRAFCAGGDLHGLYRSMVEYRQSGATDITANRYAAQFFEEETTHASYDVLEGWARKHGLPHSLYVDRDSIYRCEGLGSIAEQIAGKAPQTQFGRAMAQVGVALILAHSPQAKGRVERMNGVLQDRLVKALRLAGISDLASANAFLQQTYLPEHNRKFQVQAASEADAIA